MDRSPKLWTKLQIQKWTDYQDCEKLTDHLEDVIPVPKEDGSSKWTDQSTQKIIELHIVDGLNVG